MQGINFVDTPLKLSYHESHQWGVAFWICYTTWTFPCWRSYLLIPLRWAEMRFFSLSTHILSLQLVTELPDSTKGATKGHVVVSGPWANSYEHLDHLFEPRHSLGIPGKANCCPLILSFITIRLSLTYITWCTIGKRRRDQLVEWVDKTSFD